MAHSTNVPQIAALVMMNRGRRPAAPVPPSRPKPQYINEGITDTKKNDINLTVGVSKNTVEIASVVALAGAIFTGILIVGLLIIMCL